RCRSWRRTVRRRDRAPRLRRAAGALALALALAVPGWFLWQAYPPAVMMADLRAGTGEWKTEVLPDGTRITLNSGSAVNLRYDARRRALELLRGEILVDVSKDASRPFLVETPDGSMRAVGTRFVVSKTPDGTLLSVLESTVAVRTAQQRAAGGPDAAQVHAGQALRIHPDRVEAMTEIDASRVASAWAQHRLFADDRPLAEVLDILGRHRSGLLQYDAAAIAQVRVSAVLPLDDTERALQLIAANLPGLRIRHFTPYLVRVDLLPAP
ncbi:MAG: FecR domain-containing protein, partial [Bordetella sp.]|nr:FecR domain-containing protein [Bordetella sp.]